MTAVWDRASVPQLAVDLIAQVERFAGTAYDDGSGNWTIGYGSLHMPNGASVRRGMTISLPDAKLLLGQQMRTWVAAICANVHGTMTANQAAALISFVHNLGAGVLHGCTMIAMINAGQCQLASRQFGGWVMASGQKSLGLMRRRELERRIFVGGDLSCYASVWALTKADLLPIYQQAFADAAAWHREAVTPPAGVSRAPEQTTDELNAASLQTARN